ncbi:hypothetical protein ONS96_002524 [Cadophora gregata f. sp. sojae]|nr:hypothetical protein ONS96_002524 [Cadophora gregata f. sp. sojae]
MAVKTLLLSLMATSAMTLTHPGGLYRRDLDDASVEYLQNMCLPNLGAYMDNNGPLGLIFQSLHDSPAPCEQQAYILNICVANDTTAIDYLAEQQCVCGSNFREANEGCNACYAAHGYTSDVAGEAMLSAIWTAECSARPTQRFWDLIAGFAETATTASEDRRTTTLENDRFPSQTAVSNYWTGLPSASLGSITGSATARATTYPADDDDDEYGRDDFPSRTSTSRRANFSYNPTATGTTVLYSSESSTLDKSSQPTASTPITSAPVTAISQPPTTSTSSVAANGGGMEMGLAWDSGVVLVVVNVAVVALM